MAVDTTYLKAYYKLDEAADADAVDEVGSHTLTKDGDGGVGPDTGTGIINGARDFEAVSGNDMILYSAHHADFSPGDTAFGASMWVKIETLTGGVQFIFGKGEYNGNDLEYVLYAYAGEFHWIVCSDGHDGYADLTLTSIGALSSGVWYHIVVWHDPTANKIYGRVNNGTVDEAAHSGGAYASGTDDFYIGCRRDDGAINNSTSWDGLIDEFAWFNGGFPDSTEQAELYNSGNGLALEDWTADPWVPVPPQLEVDTTLPTGWDGTADATVSSGGDLQAAISAAVQNSGIYIIEVEAGATFTSGGGNEGFYVPNNAGTDWLIIRSSAYASLPATGTRVSPSDAADMPTIRGTSTEGALWFENGAHNIRLIGIEITSSYASTASTVYSLVNCGYLPATGVYPDTEAELPSYITFDRCYVHGNSTGNLRRAFYFDPKYGAIIDSYISDCHEVGADSQAIGCLNSVGPQLIHNNYLEAAGENILYGGGDPIIPNAVPSDITITQNHFFKPLTWKADDPSYGGIAWNVKNLFELKNAQRVLIEGNVFENCWVMGQAGYGVLFTPRNQDGGAEWSTVENITCRKNWIKNTGAGFQLLSGDAFAGSSQNLTRVLIENNLVEVNYSANGGDGRIFQMSALPSNTAEYVTIRHNTLIHLTAGTHLISLGDDPKFGEQIRINDNIGSHGTYGVFATGGASGSTALTNYFTSHEFLNNALIMDGNSAGSYSASTLFPANPAACSFTDYDNGDYSITSGTLNNAGSDGTDIGVDWAALQAAIATAESGIAPTSPVFVSPSSVNVPGGTKAVMALAASGPPAPTFTITGGADQAFFEILGGNMLRFITAPDFDDPQDAGTNNGYVVQVTATNSEGATNQTFTATVVAPLNDSLGSISSTAINDLYQ